MNITLGEISLLFFLNSFSPKLVQSGTYIYIYIFVIQHSQIMNIHKSESDTYQIKLKFIVRIPHGLTIGIVSNEAEIMITQQKRVLLGNICRSTLFLYASRSPD